MWEEQRMIYVTVTCPKCSKKFPEHKWETHAIECCWNDENEHFFYMTQAQQRLFMDREQEHLTEIQEQFVGEHIEKR